MTRPGQKRQRAQGEASSEIRRREYQRSSLNEEEVDRDPFRQFGRWLDVARREGLLEPTAMILATASRGGRPSARTVLLKGFDQEGFVFYTDYRSRKALDLTENAEACLLFYWVELERQVRIQGAASRVSRAVSEEYFQSRPRGSQLGAWASHQSAVLPGGRAELEERLREVTRKFGEGPIPLPPHWGGYRLVPDELEFWQGRANRLHDRIQYARSDEGWTIDRLSP